MALKDNYAAEGRPAGDAGRQAEPRTGEPMDNAEDEYVPEGFNSVEDFLKHWAETYNADFDYDKHNIDEGMEDLRFIYVDQWDPQTRAEREEAGRPVMTINTLPQMIGQVIGDRRINKTRIKVLPDTNGDVAEAEFRSGLLRSVENYSRAERIYDAACEDQVGCGVGNIEVTLEYSTNDVFNQDIRIKQLYNPFAVVWDRFHNDPTGRDAKHCFTEETLPRKQYEKEFPDKPIPAGNFREFNFGDNPENDDVKVLAIWHMKTKPATFALMQDGGIKDVTSMAPAEYMANVVVNPKTQLPMVREGQRTYACRYLVTNHAILEGPYELPISRLPVIKVSGRVGRVGTKKYRFGLIRWARDPSRMRNYWRSKAVETLAMSPNAQWIADSASMKGREDDFRKAHVTGDPVLIYNTGKNKPERVDPPALPSAALNESAMNAQDIKDVTGIHDASLGIRSNEVSGKAIMARQREGDVASVTYHDNLNQAIQEVGCVANELIPVCYDTTRIVRVLGVDDVPEFKHINNPDIEQSFDITDGKYDVQVVTGPSYTTQRQEGADLLLELAKVNPALFEVAGDILMETQDIPGGERIAKRLRKMLPAAQQEEQEKQQQEAEMNGKEQQVPPEVQAAQQAQEIQQQVAAKQIEFQMAEMEAKVAEAQAQAREAEAKARKAELEAEIAEENIRTARAEAERAEAGAIEGHQRVEQNDENHIVNLAERRARFSTDIQRGEESHAVDLHRKLNPPEKPSGVSNKSGGGSRSASGSRPKKGQRK